MPSLKPDEIKIKWLQDIAGVVSTTDDDFDTFLSDQKQKEEILSKIRKSFLPAIRELLGPDEKGLRAFEFKINSKRKALDVNATSLDEADVTEYDYGKLLKETTKNQRDRFSSANSKIIWLDEHLKKTRSIATGEPLFTIDEIAAELWNPLVRERLFPETLVLDKCSEVKKMIDETNRLYNEKVAEKEKDGELTPETNRLQLYSKAGLKLASIGINAAETFGGDPKALKLAGEICEFTESGIDTIMEGYETLKGDDSIKSKAISLVSTTLGAVENVADSSFLEGVGGTKISKETKAAVLENIQRACKGGKAAIALRDALVAKKPVDVGAAITDMLSIAFGAAFGETLTGKIIPEKFPYADYEKDDDGEKTFDGEGFIGDIGDWLKIPQEPIANYLKKKFADPKAIEEFEKTQQKTAKEQEEEERKKRTEDFERSLKGGSGIDAANAVQSIEKMIQQIERDRKIVETATSICEGGSDLAAKLFAPLAMVGTALAITKSFTEVAERVSALLKWRATEEALGKAQSPLLSSSQNMLLNQSRQFTHHTIQMLAKAAKLIGQILETAGTLTAATGVGAGVAAAGKIIQGLATATGETEDVLYTVYKAEDLERAWKATKKAFANPDNRRLALKARQKNPTLAKYSIAWGALSARDPIALNLMSKIGLSQESLANADTDVHLVVKYLETIYNEDNQVYRKYVGDLTWLPAEITLTSESWQLVVSGAEKHYKSKKTIKQLPGQTPIGGLIAALDSALAKQNVMDFPSFEEKIQKIFSQIGEKYKDEILNKRKVIETELAPLFSTIFGFETIAGRLNTVLNSLKFEPVGEDAQVKKEADALTGAIKTLSKDCIYIEKQCKSLRELLQTAIPPKTDTESDSQSVTPPLRTAVKTPDEILNSVAEHLNKINAAYWNDAKSGKGERKLPGDALPTSKKAGIGEFATSLEEVNKWTLTIKKNELKNKDLDLLKGKLRSIKSNLSTYISYIKTPKNDCLKYPKSIQKVDDLMTSVTAILNALNA